MTSKAKHHDLADKVASMELHPRTRRNFRMQYRLAVTTLIPWLQQQDALPDNPAVCEIGCGEGGVLDAFIERGTTYALGTDIMAPLLEQISGPLANKLGLEATFVHHDVIADDIPDVWRNRFDVVVLRDVIEHLDDPQVALKNIARIIKPGGVILLTFPPYTSAFGGHQQLLGTKAGALPFVHMLPKKIFNALVAKGDPMNRDEVTRLHRIRCSADGIIDAIQGANMNMVDERYFGLRPVFRWKYQKPIPVLEVTRIGGMGLTRALAMEAAFIARKPE